MTTARDLRGFLSDLRPDPGEVIEIHREVSPRHETAAILVKFEEKYRYPVLYFHDIAGCAYPLVTNVCGSRRRLAKALGCRASEITARYMQRCAAPIRPTVVSTGPAQERVMTGPEVDLGTLPQLVYHQGDADQPYLTAAIVVARDPESGKTNLSYHRLMIADSNRCGIFMAKGKHLDAIYQRYVAAKQAMPIAAFLGVHPLVSLGSLYSGDLEVEEYDIIGGLFERPLELLECVSQPGLRVPAYAEFVLEGTVDPEERITEGPFGEFTGYATGTCQAPVFSVGAITTRRDPIFQDIVSGHAEHAVLPLPGIEGHLLEVARAVTSGIVDLRLAAPLTVLVAMDKQDDAEPRKLIEALLASDIYTKQVIVVDGDVKPGDLQQVLSAMALQVQADRDMLVLPDQLGTPLDPSCPGEDGRSTKLGIDATTKGGSGRQVTPNEIPRALLDSIDLGEISS